MNKKIVIIYESKHQGNTYKLVKKISDKYKIEIINAAEPSAVNLDKYDIIGLASGIDFGKFYKSVENFAKQNLPMKKKVFFIYTCAMDRKGFTDSIKEIVLEKEGIILGEFGCKGYNTYGPWKIIGGMKKKHPTEKEVESAMKFFEYIVKKES